jgi:hypothetical protein
MWNPLVWHASLIGTIAVALRGVMAISADTVDPKLNVGSD